MVQNSLIFSLQQQIGHEHPDRYVELRSVRELTVGSQRGGWVAFLQFPEFTVGCKLPWSM